MCVTGFLLAASRNGSAKSYQKPIEDNSSMGFCRLVRIRFAQKQKGDHMLPLNQFEMAYGHKKGKKKGKKR
jgi:hypothetical protein